MPPAAPGADGSFPGLAAGEVLVRTFCEAATGNQFAAHARRADAHVLWGRVWEGDGAPAS